jgi:hypothetical protein
MIAGINPLTISKIRYSEGYRIGYHPMYNKVMRKKNPIRGMLGCYSALFLDGYRKPRVIIYGADGSWLKDITCRSNDHAEALYDKLTDQLSQYVASVAKQ